MQRQQTEYNSQMNTAREQFDRQANVDRNKFSERLNSLKENYDRNTRLSEAPTKEKYDGTTRRLQDTIKNDRLDHTREMQQVREKDNNHFQDYRKQVVNDTQALVKQKEEEKHGFVRQSNFDKNRLNEKMAGEMQEVNRARGAELAQMRDDQRDQLGQIHSMQDAHNKEMIGNYDHLVEANQQRNNNEQRGLLVSNNERLRAREKEYNKDLNALERHSLAIANNGGRGDEAKNELERVKRVDEERIGRMKNDLEDVKVTLTEDKSKMMDEAQKTLRQQALNNYKDHDAKDKQFVVDRAKQTDKFNRERDQITEKLTDEIKARQEDASRTAIQERVAHKTKYNSQREDYARRMNLMSDKNLQTISSIQQEQARDKTAFIEKAKRDVFETKEKLKDEVYNRLQKVEDVHQTRISNLESEKEKIVSNYEDRLMNLAKKSVSTDQERIMIEEQRRHEDMRTAKKIQEGKDFETAKVVQSLRKEFEKNLNEIGHSNELKLNRMNKHYEDVIARMTKENNLEMHRRESQSRENYERLVKTTALEKAEVENQYELKIQKMKDAVERSRELAVTRGERAKNTKLNSEDDLA